MSDTVFKTPEELLVDMRKQCAQIATHMEQLIARNQYLVRQRDEAIDQRESLRLDRDRLIDMLSAQGVDPAEPKDPRSLPLNELAQICHGWAVSHGFWDEEIGKGFLEQCFLFTSEVSEAGEQFRDGHGYTEIYYVEDKQGLQKPEGIPIELADIIYRVLDTCAFYGIDIENAWLIKHRYNEQRPYRNGGKRA